MSMHPDSSDQYIIYEEGYIEEHAKALLAGGDFQDSHRYRNNTLIDLTETFQVRSSLVDTYTRQ